MSNKPHTDRHFTEILFCGAGDHTREQVALLHKRIDEAINELGGSQQSPRWSEIPTQEMLDREEALSQESRLVREQVARDIAMALTGCEIEFQDRAK